MQGTLSAALQAPLTRTLASVEKIIMQVSIYSAVVLQSNPDAFLVKCGRCGGTGENNQEYTCHVCNGSGKALLRVPSDWAGRDVGVLKCGRCRGTGENNQEYFCKVCKGVGAIVKCFPRVGCSKCNGSGENSQEYFCSSCGACGSVWIGNVPTY